MFYEWTENLLCGSYTITFYFILRRTKKKSFESRELNISQTMVCMHAAESIHWQSEHEETREKDLRRKVVSHSFVWQCKLVHNTCAIFISLFFFLFYFRISMTHHSICYAIMLPDAITFPFVQFSIRAVSIKWLINLWEQPLRFWLLSRSWIFTDMFLLDVSTSIERSIPHVLHLLATNPFIILKSVKTVKKVTWMTKLDTFEAWQIFTFSQKLWAMNFGLWGETGFNH